MKSASRVVACAWFNDLSWMQWCLCKNLADRLWKRTGMGKEGAHNMDWLAYKLRDNNTMVSLFHWSRTYPGGISNVIWSFDGCRCSYFCNYFSLPIFQQKHLYILLMAVSCFFVVWFHRGTRNSNCYIQSMGGWWRRVGAWFWCWCKRKWQQVPSWQVPIDKR